jgi:Fe-S cluster assembly protein SufD
MLNTVLVDVLDPNDPLVSMRQKNWDAFEKIGLPSAKQEAFQYLTHPLEFPKLAQQKVTGTSFEGIVMVDGFFDHEASSISKDVILQPLDIAIRSYGLFLQNRFSKNLKNEKDPFAHLNAAFHGRGAFLYIPPNKHIEIVLKQQFVSDDMASPRIHIYLGKGASLKMRQISSGNAGFCNTFFDISLEQAAQVKLVDEQSFAHFQTIRVTQKRDSHFKFVSLSKKIRNSIEVELLEENSECEILGLSNLKNNEESHDHVLVKHSAANARSRQHFKTVLSDRARSSFEGKIFVEKQAQKTQAYQLNSNLILSDDASCNAKPNLEIFADDVKASHGATFGKLDEEMLFYLTSRGISKECAANMLIEGFLQEIIDHA